MTNKTTSALDLVTMNALSIARHERDHCGRPHVANVIEGLADTITRLQAALTDARSAIASLHEFGLGGVVMTDTHTGECTGQYGIRDELLAKIDEALRSSVGGGVTP